MSHTQHSLCLGLLHINTPPHVTKGSHMPMLNLKELEICHPRVCQSELGLCGEKKIIDHHHYSWFLLYSGIICNREEVF